MSDFTLLSYNQCNKMCTDFLDVFRKLGTSEAELTDFAKLFNEEIRYGKSYWTKDIGTQSRLGKVQTEDELMSTKESAAYVTDGKFGMKTSVDGRHGVRIALPYTSEIPHNVGSHIEDSYSLKSVEYGFYPQGVVADEVQEILEKAFKEGKIIETGKKYTVPTKDDKRIDLPNFDSIMEYEYQGKKYVRTQARFDKTQLSTGKEIQKDESIWIEVQPIKWLIDEKTNQMITEKVVLSGMQFDILQSFEKARNGQYYPKQRTFEQTLIKQFMDKCWSKEIESSKSKELENGLNADVETAKMIDGRSIKELMGARRGAERKFLEKIQQLEETTGIKIDIPSALSGEVKLLLKPQSHDRLIEGYEKLPKGGFDIADEVVEMQKYDEYTIDSNGNIKCVANNDDVPKNEPQPKQEDIEKISKFQNEFKAFSRNAQDFSQSQTVNVPNTSLTCVLSGSRVALYYSPEGYTDSKAKIEISTFPSKDGMFTYGETEIIEDMSEFLDSIKVPKDSVPEILEENIGEKISIFKKRKDDISNSTHVITDYSPIKEKLQGIVKSVKEMKKSKDKGEITNEQKSSISGEER